MVNNRRDEWGEAIGRTESPLSNFFKNLGEMLIQHKSTKAVSVTKLLNIFGKVAKEEDVVLADLACNFDLFWSQLDISDHLL